jgi:Tfp pilus tip-associated adhesin PilY1
VPNGDFPIKNFLFSTEGKEIYYAPVSSKIKNSYDEWVVFGTGDREDPLNTTEVNYIYAVKNTWMKSGLTKDNLKDISSLMYNKEAALDLGDKDGWCVSFIDPGEKMISPAIITNDTIYFTTYVPASGAAAVDDPCDNVGAAGISYLWAIDLVTGAPVSDYNNDGVKTPDERRMTAIATMAQPKLIGDMITTPKTIKIPTKINFDYFFWRQR